MSSSSKKTTDIFEPLKIETTILKVNIRTTGDFITKEYDLIPFHPNMADMKDLSNNNYILFPSFVKVTMKDLSKAGVGQDYLKAFTDLDKYIKLIKYVISADKEEDYSLMIDQTKVAEYTMSFAESITPELVRDIVTVQKYEPLSDIEIITNNICLLKTLFFPPQGHFFILGHDYVINESHYIPPYTSSTIFNKHLPENKHIPLEYTITVDLQILDAALNPGIGDYSKMSCKGKKIKIKKDLQEYFTTELKQPDAIKATLPSLLNPTTLSKRGYGKTQIEWEKRNQYVKAPTTENERLAIEKNWTPLQRKMAKFDKVQDEYNKIPPLWIKEMKELNINKKKPDYDEQKKNINEKYVIPFLEELKMKDKKKDVEFLKKKVEEIKADIASGKVETYNLPAKNQELAKTSAERAKKETDYTFLVDKYGADGHILIKTWEDTLQKMEGITSTIDTEKTSAETKIVNESVNKELEAKRKEIETIQQTIKLRKFYDGLEKDIAKSEKDSFEKDRKKNPQPLETLIQLQNEEQSLTEDYMDIAEKLVKPSAILYEYIQLYTLYMNRFKELKNKKKEEKNNKNKEVQAKQGEIKNNQSILAKYEGTDVPNMNDDVRKKLVEKNQSQIDATTKTLQKLNDELFILQGKEKNFTDEEGIFDNKKVYLEFLIRNLQQKIKDKIDTNAAAAVTTLKTEKKNLIEFIQNDIYKKPSDKLPETKKNELGDFKGSEGGKGTRRKKAIIKRKLKKYTRRKSIFKYKNKNKKFSLRKYINRKLQKRKRFTRHNKNK